MSNIEQVNGEVPNILTYLPEATKTTTAGVQTVGKSEATAGVSIMIGSSKRVA